MLKGNININNLMKRDIVHNFNALRHILRYALQSGQIFKQ